MKRVIGILLAAVCAQSFAAPNYIELKPLTDVVDTRVGAVKSGVKTLPIITWGGDLATIYGNGGASTQSNSVFKQNGLSFQLDREDVFANQLEDYLSGKTPYLRGTMGMMSLAQDLLNEDPRTRPVVFYQMTWSSGGDALVVKDSIKSAKGLKGKTIAIQAYGPHTDYLFTVLKDAGLKPSDVTLKWLPDLTGTDNSPMAAFYESDIDAAFVITPDAMALTSGGKMGTGAEDSVKGARILMSTKTANRVIADVYAVRSDYYKANKREVETLRSALIASEEGLSNLMRQRDTKSAEYRSFMGSAAQLLLDAQEAIADTQGLYDDCEFVKAPGNDQFFNDARYPRNFEALTKATTSSLYSLGLLASKTPSLDKASAAFSSASQSQVAAPRFDRDKVSAVVSRRQQQGALSDSELFSFEVFFAPNQNTFSADQYQAEFDRVVELASTYGGAIITVEGHSDPMGYLRAKKEGQQPVVLGRIKQSARNLSITRAQAVSSSVMEYAQNRGVVLDASQFEPIGHGIAQPATGVCGADPCAPKSEKEWRSNMRVMFRIIQVEAESDVFRPL